jgi:hypothetical protein
LLDHGLRARTIVYGYWGFCAAFGALTLLVDQRLAKLLALLVLAMLGLAVLVWASRVPAAAAQTSAASPVPNDLAADIAINDKR